MLSFSPSDPSCPLALLILLFNHHTKEDPWLQHPVLLSYVQSKPPLPLLLSHSSSSPLPLNPPLPALFSYSHPNTSSTFLHRSDRMRGNQPKPYLGRPRRPCDLFATASSTWSSMTRGSPFGNTPTRLQILRHLILYSIGCIRCDGSEHFRRSMHRCHHCFHYYHCYRCASGSRFVERAVTGKRASRLDFAATLFYYRGSWRTFHRWRAHMWAGNRPGHH